MEPSGVKQRWVGDGDGRDIDLGDLHGALPFLAIIWSSEWLLGNESFVKEMGDRELMLHDLPFTLKQHRSGKVVDGGD